MSNERNQPTNDPAEKLTGETAYQTEPTWHPDYQPGSDAAAQRSKLSVNVGHDISERLRSLAYTHRLSESSIVEVALTMFFARGDDALLGAMLKELGATLRRR
jgi:hypothetical protein